MTGAGWLDDATRAPFGAPAEWRFGLRHRVRWSEVDPFGHANHAAYLEWFEETRNRYLEAAGLPPLSASTPGPVLARLEVDYHRPLGYGREILVTARATTLRRTSFTMAYAAWDGALAAECRARIVLVVSATGERAAVPPEVRRRLTEDGAREE